MENQEPKPEAGKNSDKEELGFWGVTLTLASLVGIGIAAVWGGKKVVGYAKDKVKDYLDDSNEFLNVPTRCDRSSSSICEFKVIVEVKPQYISDFIRETKANRDATRRESGNKRYVIFQSTVNYAKFILDEVYESTKAEEHHRTTPHYQKWKLAIEPMMAKPGPRPRHEGIIPAEYKPIP